ncbi:unnamed protein product [Brachionus calyciflorus]|uniref:Uncharacterized protein n=1 Tax=Brachionus calyciflorus TaxID=104777 RepID=A0A814JBB1_9BILA|nr:unnamed protein product [Brachionus calyciflorus]
MNNQKAISDVFQARDVSRDSLDHIIEEANATNHQRISYSTSIQTYAPNYLNPHQNRQDNYPPLLTQHSQNQPPLTQINNNPPNFTQHTDINRNRVVLDHFENNSLHNELAHPQFFFYWHALSY